jgi:hypothetical protein
MGNIEHDIYGEHLKKHAEDVQEWGDATPERVRVRCLAAEAQVELLQEHMKWAVGALREIKARCARIVAGEFGGLDAAGEMSSIADRALARPHTKDSHVGGQ